MDKELSKEDDKIKEVEEIKVETYDYRVSCLDSKQIPCKCTLLKLELKIKMLAKERQSRTKNLNRRGRV